MYNDVHGKHYRFNCGLSSNSRGCRAQIDASTKAVSTFLVLFCQFLTRHISPSLISSVFNMVLIAICMVLIGFLQEFLIFC